MEQAGVRVLYSMPGLKVHAKIALVLRREGEALRGYAFLGTGNFNEKTARHYGDIALLTADKRLTGDVEQVFGFLNGERTQSPFDHLLVAPFAMRKGFYRLIDAEIERARAGEEAAVLLKMNSLEDEKIIRRLYKASNAGVRIQIVVRGICRLIPGVPGQSERIEVISIVDRFLEHARIFRFHNGGAPAYFLGSADWMTRNLSHRVEVVFPVYEAALQHEIDRLLGLQLADNTHARRIDVKQANRYVENDQALLRAQYAAYEWLKDREAAPVG
jgi:polyphosphate kinase